MYKVARFYNSDFRVVVTWALAREAGMIQLIHSSSLSMATANAKSWQWMAKRMHPCQRVARRARLAKLGLPTASQRRHYEVLLANATAGDSMPQLRCE